MNVNQLPPNMQAKIRVNPSTGCWEWTGAKNSRGYGQVGVLGVSRSTHRVAYELLVGPIPDDLQIDHQCQEKTCCFPTHLEPVTARVNINRRPDVNKSHCLRDHEMTPENTVIKLRKDGSFIRNCRTCRNEQQRSSRAARPSPPPPSPLPTDAAQHGTLNGYSHHGCRCAACRRAYADYMREYRRKRAS